MIQRLDQLADTKEKRYFLFGSFTLVMMLLLCLPYVLLSIRLLRLSTYEDVFALLDHPLITWTYLSRVILLCLQSPTLSFPVVLSALFRALRFFELFVYACWLLLCYKSPLRRYRRILHLMMLLCIGVFAFCFSVLFSVGTLNAAVKIIRYLALGMGIVALYASIVVIYLLCSCFLPEYRRALCYEVVELSWEDLEMMTWRKEKRYEGTDELP